jgi:hypothetical protein
MKTGLGQPLDKSSSVGLELRQTADSGLRIKGPSAGVSDLFKQSEWTTCPSMVTEVPGLKGAGK